MDHRSDADWVKHILPEQPLRGVSWYRIRVLAFGVSALLLAGLVAEFVLGTSRLGWALYLLAGLGMLMILTLAGKRFFVKK